MNQKELVYFVGKARFYGKPQPATLVIKPNTITIYLGFGVYQLSSNQVVTFSLSPDPADKSINIQHTSLRCPGKIKFFCKTSPSSILEEIRCIGFIPSENSSDIVPKEKTPIRWYVPLIFVFIPMFSIYISFLNSTFKISLLGMTEDPKIPMLMFSIGCLTNSIICFMIRFSPTLQHLMLKPERLFHEVLDEFNSIASISMAMLILVNTTALNGLSYKIVSMITFITILGLQNFGHRIRALWIDGV